MIQVRRELADQPALALGPGRRDSTIWNLSLVLRKLGRNGNEGRWDRAFLVSHFGRDVTDRLRLALMAYWRSMRPTVRCERRLGEENTYLVVWSIGLMGVYAEAEAPLWATKLSHGEAELATRYALLEPNGLPSWIGSLARRTHRGGDRHWHRVAR